MGKHGWKGRCPERCLGCWLEVYKRKIRRLSKNVKRVAPLCDKR